MSTFRPESTHCGAPDFLASLLLLPPRALLRFPSSLPSSHLLCSSQPSSGLHPLKTHSCSRAEIHLSVDLVPAAPQTPSAGNISVTSHCPHQSQDTALTIRPDGSQTPLPLSNPYSAVLGQCSLSSAVHKNSVQPKILFIATLTAREY
jgi:hypothetical protein